MKRYVLIVSLLSCSAMAMAETTNPALLAATCAPCHGTEGRSLGENKTLAGIDKAYFLEQIQKFKTGEREATVMKTYASGLTDTEIEMLADYFSQLSP